MEMKIGNFGRLSELGKGRLGKLYTSQGKDKKSRLTSSSVSRVSTGVAPVRVPVGAEIISVGATRRPGGTQGPIVISPVGVQALPEPGAERRIKIIQKPKDIQPTGGITTSGITSGISETGIEEGISKSAW